MLWRAKEEELVLCKHPALNDIFKAMEEVLWVLQSDARWRDLHERYPTPATSWRRLRLWKDLGVWLYIWGVLPSLMRIRI